MKKILILAVLLITYNNLFAFLRQSNWRWRKDDGTEITASWLAAENAAPTISSSTDILRLRIEVYSPLNESTNTNDTLQWALSEAGPWTNIETASASAPFIIAGSSAYVTQGEATTSQLSSSVPAYTWYPGKITVDSMLLKATLPSENRTEYEWCLRPTPSILTNTTYYFRTWGSISEKRNGKTYPSLKTAAVLPIHLASFKVQPDNNRVKVLWTTASELNNDRFEVQRSADAANWKTVATIKGNGTSSVAHNYQALDVNPGKGMNYYRIKQYDVNGKANVSEIRSLSMLIGKSQISVFPNPVKRNINFSLQSDLSDVAVTLTNSNGKMIHRESRQSILANTNYTLNPKQQPAPGVYILHLEAKGFSESIKIVVQ